MVLYKKKFDYCRFCEKEAEEIKMKFQREYEYEYTILDSRLKAKEGRVIREIENKNSSEFKINE